ncbi:hypothetical protein [Acinetobacter phage vB_AbaS_TCUP2199]|nr:hypothetical protein [Acinetobacter phage vB_AbaS_TCUP2199]
MPDDVLKNLRGVLHFSRAELASPPQPFSEEIAAEIRAMLYPPVPLYLSRKSIFELMNEGHKVTIEGKEWRPAHFYLFEHLYDQDLPVEATGPQPDIAELKRKQAVREYFGIDAEQFEAGVKKAAEAFQAMSHAAQMKFKKCEGPCSGKCGENQVTQDRKVSGDHVGAVSMANARQTADINPQARYEKGGFTGTVKQFGETMAVGANVEQLPKVGSDIFKQVRGMDPDEHQRIQDHYNESVAMAAGSKFQFEPARMMNVRQGYSELAEVLALALEQAQNGKGNARHQVGTTPFIAQPICELARLYGVGYNFGQAAKKAHETQQLESKEAKLAEILGGINYLAAAYIVIAEQE